MALGLAFGAALWIGGEPEDGLWALGVMVVFGLLIAVGGRSETIRGLRGDGRDERFERLDRDATALAGIVLISVVLVMCGWEWAHGRDGSPYVQLGAISGLAYLVAVVALRLRG